MANICLVDDEKALNQVLKVYLEREGHKVTTFYNMQDIYNQVEKPNFMICTLLILCFLTEAVRRYLNESKSAPLASQRF